MGLKLALALAGAHRPENVDSVWEVGGVEGLAAPAALNLHFKSLPQMLVTLRLQNLSISAPPMAK